MTQSNGLSRILIVIPILLLALALRLTEMHGQSLWYDEAVELQVATQPLPQLIEAVKVSTYDPPLFSLVLNVWAQIGHSDLWVRFFPVMASTLATAAMFVLGSTFFSTSVGWFSALFMAVAPRAVHYGYELNQYAFVLLLTALDILMLERYLKNPTKWRLSALLLMGVISIFTHYEMVPYLMALVLTGSGVLVLKHAMTQHRRVLSQWLGGWSGVAVVGALLMWFYALPQEKLRPHLAVSVRFTGSISLPTEIGNWLTETNSLMHILLWGFQATLLAWITTGLLLIGIIAALYRSSSRRLVVYFVLSLLVAYIMARVGLMLYVNRYVLYALPLGILLMCGGIFSLAVGRFRRYLQPAACMALIILALLLTSALPTFSGIPYPETEQIGEVMQIFQANYQHGDGVFVYYGAKPTFVHYASEDQITAAFLQPWSRGVTAEQQQATLWAAMSGKTRVWLLMSHVAPSDASFLPDALKSRCRQVDSIKAIGADGYLFECAGP